MIGIICFMINAVDILNYARMIANVDSSRLCVFGVVNLGLQICMEMLCSRPQIYQDFLEYLCRTFCFSFDLGILTQHE